MDPFLGEIRMFGGQFAPRGWADCNGQLLQISQNDALYSLIGTTYGGDGITNFALPDLRSRIPIGMQGNLGTAAGTETVTLTSAMNPTHAHPAGCGGDATTTNPIGGYWAKDPGNNVAQFSNQAPAGAVMAPDAITIAGGGQPHDNIQPYLCIRYIIALEGIFPTQN